MSVRVKSMFTCDGFNITVDEHLLAKQVRCLAFEEAWAYMGMGDVSDHSMPHGWTAGYVPTGEIFDQGTPWEFHQTRQTRWEHRCPDHPIKKS